jgi:hypothetical protein
VHHEDWLDFNMWQTGHSNPELDTSVLIGQDRAKIPTRPVLDGEPCYENIPLMGGGWDPTGMRFTAADARRRAWRGVLGGACGHTYGCNEIWMMHKHGDEQFVGANMDWKCALHLPGANQMRHLRALIESRPFTELEPSSGIVQTLDANVYADSNLQNRVRWTPWPAEVRRSLARLPLPDVTTCSFICRWGPREVDFSRLVNRSSCGGMIRARNMRHGGTTASITDWIDPRRQTRIGYS